jgi:hypothetical protein
MAIDAENDLQRLLKAGGGINREDPITALGGVTAEQFTLGTRDTNKDGMSETLYAAVLAGDTQQVAAYLSNINNRPLTEAEMSMLAQAQQHAAEHAAADHKTGDPVRLAAAEEKKEKREEWQAERAARAAEDDIDAGAAEKTQPYVIDRYGGYVDAKGDYYDKFGGHYDADGSGYTFKDGSYMACCGVRYDSKTNKIFNADGTEAKDIPPELSAPSEKKGVVEMEGEIAHRCCHGGGHRQGGHGAAGAPATESAAAQNAANNNIKEGGGLEAVTRTPEEARAQRELAVETAKVAKEDGVEVNKAAMTNERLSRAQERIANRRQLHEADYKVFTASLAGGADPHVPEGYEVVSAKDVAKRLAHSANKGDTVTGTWYADNKGGYYDDKGGYYDKRGGYFDKAGGYTKSDGTYMDPNNNYVDKKGNLTTADGKYYEARPGVDYREQLKQAATSGTDWKPPTDVEPTNPPTFGQRLFGIHPHSKFSPQGSEGDDSSPAAMAEAKKAAAVTVESAAPGIAAAPSTPEEPSVRRAPRVHHFGPRP